MQTKKGKVDVLVENHGSLFLFILLSKQAQKWAEANVQTEGYQWTGKFSFAVEHRFAENLSNGMQEAGLTVK